LAETIGIANVSDLIDIRRSDWLEFNGVVEKRIPGFR
jgi:hypothetical protein